MPGYNPDVAQLLQLAQDAGMVEPSLGGSQEQPWDSIQAEPDAPSQDPNTPWSGQNRMAQVMPGTLAPPDMPPDAMGSPQAPQLSGYGSKTGGGSGASVSAGRSGMNFSTLGKLDSRDQKLNGEFGAIDNTLRQDYAPVLAQESQARDEHKDAVVARLTADQQHIADERDAATLMKGLHDEFTKAEQNILLGETARKNQLISQYTTSLADFGASKIDPNQLWHGMSGGMRFGTMVTAFVHDFLGAKGIKTSAMDTLNTAIDRNINAQMHNINNKLEVAKGFKTLYEMESSKSASAAETRSRIKGYMLESAKQHIIANMSQYQSLLATAQGKEALAQIDSAYAKNYLEVVNHIETSSTARQGQMISWEDAKMRNAVETLKASAAVKSNDLAERKFTYEQNKDKAGAQAAADAAKIVDPETNKNKWRLKNPDDKVGERQVRDAVAATASSNRALEDLRTLARKVGGGNIVNVLADGTRFNDEDRRQYEAIADRLAHSLVKANGERATEQDIAQFRKSMPSINTALTNGGVDQILAHTHKESLTNAQDILQQYTYDLPENEQTSGPTNQIFEKGRAEAKATEDMQKRGGYKPDDTSNLISEMSGPAGHKAASKEVLKAANLEQPDAQLEWLAAVEKDPKIASIRGARGSYFDDDSQETKRVKDPGEVPTWAVAVMGFKRAAKGDPTAMNKLVKLATIDPTVLQSQDPTLADFNVEDLYHIHHLAQYELFALTGKTPEVSDPSEVAPDSSSAMYTGSSALNRFARPTNPGSN